MSDEKVPEGFTSTGVGADTNEPVTGPQYRPGEQKPDQFFNGEAERPENQEAPKSHATKGMTRLGWSEASRIENTAKLQEQERREFEKLQAKAEKEND